MNETEMEQSFEKAVEMPENTDGEKFVIDDMKKAEWATKKIAQRQMRINEIKAFAKAKIERINKWIDDECQPLENDIRHFEEMLRDFTESEIAKLKRGKTVKLSNGAKLSMKKTQPNFVYDDAELLDFLNEHQLTEFIKTETKVKPMWKEFKAACNVGDVVCTDENGNEYIVPRMISPDGEIIELITIVMPERDEMNVDVKAVEI